MIMERLSLITFKGSEGELQTTYVLYVCMYTHSH